MYKINDPIFEDLSNHTKLVYLALLQHSEPSGGFIDFSLADLIDNCDDNDLKLSMMELAVKKLVAEYEGFLYLPFFPEHTKEKDGGGYRWLTKWDVNPHLP